ncbi:MAG: glycosyltransferase family 4 protein [Verrucomicrobiota bacterium]
MKFVMITHEFPPFYGGVGTYCVELAMALHKLGYCIEVWAPNYLANQDDIDRTMPFPVKRLQANGSLKIPSLLQMGRQIIRDHQQLMSRVILLPSVGAQIMMMVGRLFHVVPSYLTYNSVCIWHGSEIYKFESNKLLYIAAQMFFPYTKLLASASRFSGCNLKGSILCAVKERVITLPCACSSPAMRNGISIKPETNGRVRILTLARVHHRKGHREVIEALGKLDSETKNSIVYHIAGKSDHTDNGQYLQELIALSKKLGITLEYLGPVAPEKLAQAYANCEIYAMTSRTLKTSVEGFGITYLEAGLQSKPVIGYRTGGVAEAVKDGQTGILVDEGDIHTLSKELKKLIQDRNLRDRLGQAGRKHALTFSWENTAQKLVDHLKRQSTYHE